MPVLKVYKNGNWEELGGTSPMDGGNADTVDGKHASEFASIDHTHKTLEDVSSISSGANENEMIIWSSGDITLAAKGHIRLGSDPSDNMDAATKQYVVNNIIANKISVDNTLSDSSTNPVQNKIINTALNSKADAEHTHDEYVTATFVETQINNALANSSSGKTLTQHLVEENMILSSRQYGDTLPGENGEPYTHVPGRIFFLKVSE